MFFARLGSREDAQVYFGEYFLTNTNRILYAHIFQTNTKGRNIHRTSQTINIWRFPYVQRRRIVKFSRFTIEYGISHRAAKKEKKKTRRRQGRKGISSRGRWTSRSKARKGKSKPEQRIHISAPELRNPPVSTLVRYRSTCLLPKIYRKDSPNFLWKSHTKLDDSPDHVQLKTFIFSSLMCVFKNPTVMVFFPQFLHFPFAPRCDAGVRRKRKISPNDAKRRIPFSPSLTRVPRE